MLAFSRSQHEHSHLGVHIRPGRNEQLDAREVTCGCRI
jgi:hypothetical protein